MPEEYTFLLISIIHIHFPGSPGPISRESGNGKIVGIPENREREIPRMKHYNGGPHLLHFNFSYFNNGDKWKSI
jgi:hypothetical protein